MQSSLKSRLPGRSCSGCRGASCKATRAGGASTSRTLAAALLGPGVLAPQRAARLRRRRLPGRDVLNAALGVLALFPAGLRRRRRRGGRVAEARPQLAFRAAHAQTAAPAAAERSPGPSARLRAAAHCGAFWHPDGARPGHSRGRGALQAGQGCGHGRCRRWRISDSLCALWKRLAGCNWRSGSGTGRQEPHGEGPYMDGLCSAWRTMY